MHTHRRSDVTIALWTLKKRIGRYSVGCFGKPHFQSGGSTAMGSDWPPHYHSERNFSPSDGDTEGWHKPSSRRGQCSKVDRMLRLFPNANCLLCIHTELVIYPAESVEWQHRYVGCSFFLNYFSFGDTSLHSPAGFLSMFHRRQCHTKIIRVIVSLLLLSLLLLLIVVIFIPAAEDNSINSPSDPIANPARGFM